MKKALAIPVSSLAVSANDTVVTGNFKQTPLDPQCPRGDWSQVSTWPLPVGRAKGQAFPRWLWLLQLQSIRGKFFSKKAFVLLFFLLLLSCLETGRREMQILWSVRWANKIHVMISWQEENAVVVSRNVQEEAQGRNLYSITNTCWDLQSLTSK